MSAEWFYRSGGAEVGPLTAEEMREAVAGRTVTPQTEVRHGSRGTWRTASAVKGLFPMEAVFVKRPMWRVAVAYLLITMFSVSALFFLAGFFMNEEGAFVTYISGAGLAALAYLIQSVASFAEHIQQKRQAAAASPPSPVQVN